MSLFFSYSMESPSIVAIIERPRRAFFHGVNVNHQFDSPDFIGHFPPAHMHLPGPFAFLGFVWLGIFRSLKQLSQGVLYADQLACRRDRVEPVSRRRQDNDSIPSHNSYILNRIKSQAHDSICNHFGLMLADIFQAFKASRGVAEAAAFMEQ